jgi:hypothetical protein
MPARLDGAACVVTLIYGAHELVVDAGDLTVAELQSAFQDVLSLDAIPEVYLNGERVKEPDIAPRSGDRLDFMKPGGVKGSNVVCDLNEFVTVFDVSAEELCQLREAGVPFVPYGSYTVIGIKEGRRALEQIRQQPATVEQVVRVDPELGVVFYRGNAYEMDQLYLAIVKALADANGEVRSRAAIQASSTLLADESRIDRCIAKLKQQHRTIGKLIEPVPSKGYRLNL